MYTENKVTLCIYGRVHVCFPSLCAKSCLMEPRSQYQFGDKRGSPDTLVLDPLKHILEYLGERLDVESGQKVWVCWAPTGHCPPGPWIPACPRGSPSSELSQGWCPGQHLEVKAPRERAGLRLLWDSLGLHPGGN